MSRGSSSICLALLGLFLAGFLVMVVVRLIANSFLPDETLNSLAEIPWRVYVAVMEGSAAETDGDSCLLYTSPSPRDRQKSRMPSSA